MTTTPATSPAQIYLAGLSPGSRQGMRQSLDIIAGMLHDDHNLRSATINSNRPIHLIKELIRGQ